MKSRYSSEVIVIACGFTAWLAVSVLRGSAVGSLPLVAVFFALGMSLRTPVFPILLGCSLVAVISPVLMPWAILVSGLSASVAGSDRKVRLAGLAAVSSSFLIMPLATSCVLTGVSAVGAVIGKRRLGYLLVPAGFAISALVGILPGPVEVEPVIAGSTISEGRITYEIPEIYASDPVVLLPAPFQGTWTLCLSLESGGTRDTMPVMAVRLGEDSQSFPPGSESLELTVCPGDTVAIELLRGCDPMNHPVIHAGAEGRLR